MNTMLRPSVMQTHRVNTTAQIYTESQPAVRCALIEEDDLCDTYQYDADAPLISLLDQLYDFEKFWKAHIEPAYLPEFSKFPDPRFGKKSWEFSVEDLEKNSAHEILTPAVSGLAELGNRLLRTLDANVSAEQYEACGYWELQDELDELECESASPQRYYSLYCAMREMLDRVGDIPVCGREFRARSHTEYHHRLASDIFSSFIEENPSFVNRRIVLFFNVVGVGVKHAADLFPPFSGWTEEDLDYAISRIEVKCCQKVEAYFSGSDVNLLDYTQRLSLAVEFTRVIPVNGSLAFSVVQ